MENQDHSLSDSDDPDFVLNFENDTSGSSLTESSSSINEIENTRKRKKYKKKRLKKQNIHDCMLESEKLNKSAISLTAEEEKKRTDSLWKTFLKDTGSSSKWTSSSTSTYIPRRVFKNSLEPSHDNEVGTAKSEFVNCTTNCVSGDTKDKVLKEPCVSNRSSPLFNLQKDSSKKNLSNILSKINKKPKLTILEKSKLEWNEFKEENKLTEELSTFNRGKYGYLEKQDFLQRTDTRQFEIEKELRNIGKRKIG